MLSSARWEASPRYHPQERGGIVVLGEGGYLCANVDCESLVTLHATSWRGMRIRVR